MYVALDLGAESGRAMLANLSGGTLAVEEVYRFANEPVWYNGEFHWDLPRLWREIGRALAEAGARSGGRLAGIGVDTWGLDYALLGEDGTLLENPFHYRDPRTDGMIERVCEVIPAEEIYRTTGIQFMQINTLYQLYAESLKKPALLRHARNLVTIPDLFNFWLTGVIACEYTNATTTQFLNASSRDWARGLLERLDIPTHFLTPVIQPGTVLGPLSAAVARQAGLKEAPVIAPACHDTGSAVAAIPANGRSAYISSGTWSLLGAELERPVLSAEAHRLNFTNEGGVCGTSRLLKNIAGMWLLQCCRQHWRACGQDLGYAELADAARSAPPFETLVNPDHRSFLHPENMPETIAAFCRATGQNPPQSVPGIVRCVLESLALKYRYVLDALECVTGMRFEEVRIVGGGARNTLLNEFTAEATGRRVVAGPVEATALGNVAMQLLATGAAASLAEARSIIDRSIPTQTFDPVNPAPWQRVYERFRQYCEVV
jgi:rhamnulokinase